MNCNGFVIQLNSLSFFSPQTNALLKEYEDMLVITKVEEELERVHKEMKKETIEREREIRIKVS